jgi:hypothetical protein
VTRILREGGPAEYDKVPWYVAVRVGRHKYIRYLRPGEPEEVYDLAADPEELTNLVGHGEHAALLARLRETAVAELRRTGAEFLPHLPRPAAAGPARKGD